MRKGANGSRECAPDDRLRDEAIHLSVMPRYGLLRFARNDDQGPRLRLLSAIHRRLFALRGPFQIPNQTLKQIDQRLDLFVAHTRKH